MNVLVCDLDLFLFWYKYQTKKLNVISIFWYLWKELPFDKHRYFIEHITKQNNCIIWHWIVQTARYNFVFHFWCFFEANPKLCFSVSPLALYLKASTISKDIHLVFIYIVFGSNKRKWEFVFISNDLLCWNWNNNTSCP